MVPDYITSAMDLVTEKGAVSEGFAQQARDKFELAKAYIAEAAILRSALEIVSNPEDLANIPEVRGPLLTAIGVSAKAVKNLGEAQVVSLLEDAIPALAGGGPNWRQALRDRFLLTQGDSLGGAIRNVIGARARERFSSFMASSVGSTATTKTSATGKVRQFRWGNRVAIFDRKPKLVGRNIDVIILDTSAVGTSVLDEKHATVQPLSDKALRLLIESKSTYIACGELKGGVDPAGADEHWKTANSALDHVRRTFGIGSLPTFFVGAAIESAMASEILRQLRTNILTYAANLTKDHQMTSLTEWLASL